MLDFFFLSLSECKHFHRWHVYFQRHFFLRSRNVRIVLDGYNCSFFLKRTQWYQDGACFQFFIFLSSFTTLRVILPRYPLGDRDIQYCHICLFAVIYFPAGGLLARLFAFHVPKLTGTQLNQMCTKYFSCLMSTRLWGYECRKTEADDMCFCNDLVVCNWDTNYLFVVPRQCVKGVSEQWLDLMQMFETC